MNPIHRLPASKLLRALAAAFLAGMPALAAAQAADAKPATPEKPWELLAPLHVVKLENGMTFLLYPNKRAPIFSAVIRFDVGGKDELPGETGIAHMFEHMAFKGTSRIGTTDWPAESAALKKVEAAATVLDAARDSAIDAGTTSPEKLAELLAPQRKTLAAAQAEAGKYVVSDEFDRIYTREGASDLNAHTSADDTAYVISLPSNRIELWAKMESERLIDPAMREFYKERDVVMEERRMRQDNDPFGKLYELTLGIAFLSSPYSHPTIGWASDIRNLKADRARAFFDAHYTPDKAVAALVGDLDVEKTTELLKATFGKIPAAKGKPSQERIVPELPQQGERRAVLRDNATPMILMSWHKPCAPDIDDVRAEALQEVLTGGRSARWFEKFVKQDRVAADIGIYTDEPGEELPNLYMVYSTPQGKTTLAQLEKEIETETARLRTEPVKAEELASAKKRLRANATRALETNMGLAEQLADSAQISGDPYYLERRLRQLEGLTAEDLRAFAAKYLIDENLTVTTLEPPAKKE